VGPDDDDGRTPAPPPPWRMGPAEPRFAGARYLRDRDPAPVSCARDDAVESPGEPGDPPLACRVSAGAEPGAARRADADFAGAAATAIDHRYTAHESATNDNATACAELPALEKGVREIGLEGRFVFFRHVLAIHILEKKKNHLQLCEFCKMCTRNLSTSSDAVDTAAHAATAMTAVCPIISGACVGRDCSGCMIARSTR
jgi:hypothetical protein